MFPPRGPTVHFHANQTPFRMKGFAQALGLKQRHKVTRKLWGFILVPSKCQRHAQQKRRLLSQTNAFVQPVNDL